MESSADVLSFRVRGWVENLAERLAPAVERLSPTLIPMKPVLEGPRIVWVYLSPVAPGKPVTLRERNCSVSSSERGGLDGAVSSGQRSGSAKEAVTMYELEENEGFKDMRRAP